MVEVREHRQPRRHPLDPAECIAGGDELLGEDVGAAHFLAHLLVGHLLEQDQFGSQPFGAKLLDSCDEEFGALEPAVVGGVQDAHWPIGAVRGAVISFAGPLLRIDTERAVGGHVPPAHSVDHQAGNHRVGISRPQLHAPCDRLLVPGQLRIGSEQAIAQRWVDDMRIEIGVGAVRDNHRPDSGEPQQQRLEPPIGRRIKREPFERYVQHLGSPQREHQRTDGPKPHPSDPGQPARRELLEIAVEVAFGADRIMALHHGSRFKANTRHR